MIRKKIYTLIRRVRLKRIAKLIKYEEVADLGATDNLLNRYLKSNKYQWYDINAKGKHHLDIENIRFKNNSKEAVVCCEVLEHTKNPIKAIKELKKVYSKQLIISVPYEPYFSFFRFGWDKEHFWAIRPEILKYYLGKPKHDELFFFRRYYIGIWEK